VGNIDAAAVLYLLKKSDMDVGALESILYTKSGLLGLSGKTQFVKELIDLEKAGDALAEEALTVFSRAVKKYIGAYSALLGGLDLLVFTATIGERSEYMRAKICSGLEYLGITSNDAKVVVIPTDEMAEMAKHCV
jgi:acetate kinase